ncbi:MAG: ChbG/HpnK family deacetylase [Bacteroidia bacterium]|nr:ChbG/HpnK family deacetylase [Bacteroidia bacterium]
MKVVLHADDFGFDKDSTQATIELLECGVLTSATIMATMPCTEEACAYATKHPDMSFGVHMTFVDGLNSVLKDIPTLVGTDGKFLPSNYVRNRAMMLRLRKDDIVRESIAQIKALMDAGVKVSHIDSHGHLHKFPSFLLALDEITKQTGIYRVRRVQNVFVNKPKISPTTLLNTMFDWNIAHRFKTTDFFYMSANALDTNWSDAILAEMDKLPQDAIIEVGVHPGHVDTEDECWRIAEYNDMKDFAEKLRKGGKHHIITWNEV